MVITATTNTATASTMFDTENNQSSQYQPQGIPLSMDTQNISALISPLQSYTLANEYIFEPTAQSQQPLSFPGSIPYGYQPQQQLKYVYPISPPLSLQYYSGYPLAYQPQPCSTAMLPRSPPVIPPNPPFNPIFQGATNLTNAPPIHAAYIISPPDTQQSPPSPRHDIITSFDPEPHRQSYVPQHQQSSPPAEQLRQNHTHPQHQLLQPDCTTDRMLEQQKIQCSEPKQQYYPVDPHSMYVRGLPSWMTNEKFFEMCSTYGTVISSRSIVDVTSRKFKGYGFAMFAKHEDCLMAIDLLNKKPGLQASFSKICQTSFYLQLQNLGDENSTSIYISHLPLDMTEEKLEALFLPCKVLSCRILRNRYSSGGHGIALARMVDRYSALEIIDRFDGKAIPGSLEALHVRFSDTPAQKSLKRQRFKPKRYVRPIHTQVYQPKSTAQLQTSPVTPETILGLASSHYQSSSSPSTLSSTNTSAASPSPTYSFEPWFM